MNLMIRPRLTRVTTLGVRLAATGLVMCMASGCIKGRIGGTQPPDVVINELRDDNIALKKQVATLQQSIDQRLAEIDTLRQQVEGARPLAGVEAPRVVKLSFGRYSSAIDSDGDKRDDVIRLYVKPMDQQDRFLPATGKATLRAVLLRADKQPLVLATLEISPEQWDKAYRTGMTGSHFSIELPLSGTDAAALNTLKKGVHEITVMVSFTDASMGATLNHQAAYSVRR